MAGSMSGRIIALATILLLGLGLSGPAEAHVGEGLIGGFASGFSHPLLGPDHIVAMVAVGMWGAFLGAPAIWLLPVVFPLVMAGGVETIVLPEPSVVVSGGGLEASVVEDATKDVVLVLPESSVVVTATVVPPF